MIGFNQIQIMNVGDEVSTEYVEYADSSDYVSSTERNTPFPSLTLSKKFELERYLHNGQIVSKFSESNVIKPESLKDIQQQDSVTKESVTKQPANEESVTKQSANEGCCLLL